MSHVYKNIAGLRPRRSAFNNSFTTQFNCDMGQLIPVAIEECIPGDRLDISMEAVIRFQALVAPVLHEIYMRTFHFFVAHRTIMNRDTVEDNEDTGTWHDFITGGDDGKDTTVLPTWKRIQDEDGTYRDIQLSDTAKYSFWDYCGFPLNVIPTDDTMPLRFGIRCYNFIYNEYFRDQNLMEPVPLDNPKIRNVCWSKDRFTTALYDTQRGDRPAVPLTGLSGVNFLGELGATNLNNISSIIGMDHEVGPAPAFTGKLFNSTVGGHNVNSVGTNAGWSTYAANSGQAFKNWLNQNSIDLNQAVTFDVIDMRRIFQLQKMLERNMRAGARYTEQLRARFGIRPQDSRLQRPEFIGGTRQPVIVSEVLNTTGTAERPQGDMAGHGITAEKSRVGRYYCQEHGYYVALMCVQPVPLYNLGINKQWQRRTRYDFPTPELVNLSEIAVKNSELCVTGTARDDEIFGFQGIYDEMRIKESRVCADMRQGQMFDYWNLARDDYDKDNPPSLNENFVVCKPSKRIFEVQNEPGLIVNYATLIRAVRPLPLVAEPGLIDHH